MKQYVLDTNICIYYLKGLFLIDQTIKKVGLSNCYISEVTIAELKFGAANSTQKEKKTRIFNDFIDGIQSIPFLSCLDVYAAEKSRLRKLGTPIDEFDLLIGCTAVVHDMVLVTNNEKHFTRIEGIQIENWAK